MSVLQSTQKELRYLKRKNLEQEATIVGNYYRDIIRSYGIDCIYWKLDTGKFDELKRVIDQNTVLKQAYGYDMQPDYKISAEMVTYMEVEQDIFQLQKYGLNPNTDVNFYFDRTGFACDLATKLGQYKEYKIEEKEVVCEVPACTDEITTYIDPETGENLGSAYVSASVFPYNIGLGYAEDFKCEMLSGKLSAMINGYVVGEEHTVVCDPYVHTDFKVELPTNEYICRSFKNQIKTDDYLQILPFLTFKVDRNVVDVDPITKKENVKYILHGKIHGAVLFYDIMKVGKYLEMIHPEVGDVVAIDFPDDKNRETYEITECFDKQLTQDGISPLLHKYIWKCKARRRIDSYDNISQQEDDDRRQEQMDFESFKLEEVAKKKSLYHDNEDAAYGGYDNDQVKYDQRQNKHEKERHDLTFIDNGQMIHIMDFACGSKLLTDGYDLLFQNAKGTYDVVAMLEHRPVVNAAVFSSNTKWLKASKDCITFTNIQGQTTKLADNDEADTKTLQLCLNDMFNTTDDSEGINKHGDNFIKFKGCRSVLFATAYGLFAKLENSEKLYCVVNRNDWDTIDKIVEEDAD